MLSTSPNVVDNWNSLKSTYSFNTYISLTEYGLESENNALWDTHLYAQLLRFVLFIVSVFEWYFR